MGISVLYASECVEFKGTQTSLFYGYLVISSPSIHCLIFILMISYASASHVIITWEYIFH